MQRHKELDKSRTTVEGMDSFLFSGDRAFDHLDMLTASGIEARVWASRMQHEGEHLESDAMSRLQPSRSAKRARPARAPFVLKFAAACLQAIAITALADPHEATRFSVPSGAPDDTMRAAAAFALELQPDAEISFRDSQSGSLSVSRVEGDRIHCILRLSPDTDEALMPLNRFLNGRLDRDAQAMWALAHEIGHCKLRDAFLNRTDGHVADASVFPWLAQEAAADAYGILS